MAFELSLSPLVARLRSLLLANDLPVFLVGGAVRDAMLGHASHDLDFVCERGAVRLAYRVGDALGAPAYALDRERDTGRVVLAKEETTLDFAAFRAPDLEGDLFGRDFTVNAMALPVGESMAAAVIDPWDGRADLEAGLIRPVHAQSIASDPVRALRGIRLAVQLGFGLPAEARAAIAGAAPLLADVTAERVRDELLKMLRGSRPHDAVMELAALGLLAIVLPELSGLVPVSQAQPHQERALAHTASVLRWLVEVEAAAAGANGVRPALRAVRDRMAPYRGQLSAHLARPVDGGVDGRDVLRLGALFHDVGKGAMQGGADDRLRFVGHEEIGAELAAERLRALRLSNDAIGAVRRIVGGHMRPFSLARAERLTPRATFRFFRDLGETGLDVGLLSLADHLATHEGMQSDGKGLLDVVDRLFHDYFATLADSVASPPLLDGREIMAALNLKPGRQVGRLLDLLAEAQAAGEVNNKADALELLRSALE